MTPLEHGSYRFTTLTGSLYALELGPVESTPTRLPKEQPGHERYRGMPSDLRRDAEPIRVLEVGVLEVGERGEFTLDLVEDGVPITARSISPVTSVDRIG